MGSLRFGNIEVRRDKLVSLRFGNIEVRGDKLVSLNGVLEI